MNLKAFLISIGLLILAGSVPTLAKILQSTVYIDCPNRHMEAFVTTVYDDATGEVLRQFGTDCGGKAWHVEYADTSADRVFFTVDPGPNWAHTELRQWETPTASLWYKFSLNDEHVVDKVWGKLADGRYYVVQAPLIYSPE